MSELFEKRPDGASRRQTRADKERKEKRKVRIIAVCVVSVLVLLFAGAMFINSNLIRRTMPALTIGGVNFSAVEFDYNFLSAVNEYQNYYTQMLGDYASEYLPSTDMPLSDQVYNQQTGETWADYFSEITINNMSGMTQIYNAAKANGYVLPDETVEALNEEIAMVKLQAEMYGFPSLENFLKQVYGTNLNERSLRKVLQFSYTVASYSKYVNDSFTYSAAELAEYYSENADSLDTFTFRGFLVNAAYVDENDFESDVDYQKAKEASLALARGKAAEIASIIETEDDFIEAAREYDEGLYEEAAATLAHYPGSTLNYEAFGEWMKVRSRVYGDITTEDSSTGAGTYVIFFIERNNNEYKTVEMRQLLIQPQSFNPEDYEEGEEDPDFIDAVVAANIEAAELAEEVKKLFIEGGATEEKLLELIPEYSSDSTEGGFVDKISRYANDPEIDEWLFAPGRKYGDYILIETESYGYHLLFFMGFGDRYCDVLADNDLREAAYKEWAENLAPAEAVKRWAFILRQRR